ncbi:MAG: DUF4328 domain-containing protein [Nannocystis sp.]|nr:DUF4328 domain-containing protein [Nannocystis sp.]MBA3549520.1 DUF4328 domain-containing protein [Nannocystis sp.]
MNARAHHFSFAKKLIPTHTFQSTDMMFAELTGPKREAFVFYLWNEAGKADPPALPHVGVSGSTMSKLEVVGAIKSFDQEIVVISMPPTEQPNEAVFIALVRRAAGPSVFFWERTRDQSGNGVSPTDTVLSEVRPEGMRINHGFHKGLDLASFKRTLGDTLGLSLDGLERSLPEITMAAFRGAPAAGTGKGVGIGGVLASLLFVRAFLPLALFLISRIGLGSLFGPLWRYIPTIYLALSVAVGVCLIIWCYQVHNARRGQTAFSPGMAVGGFFIPLANLVLVPLIVRSAWKAVVGAGGGLLILFWWLFWMVEIAINMMIAQNVLPPGLVDAVGLTVINYSITFAPVLAYGLLWYIVKTINARV